jgi:hypothetical protein
MIAKSYEALESELREVCESNDLTLSIEEKGSKSRPRKEYTIKTSDGIVVHFSISNALLGNDSITIEVEGEHVEISTLQQIVDAIDEYRASMVKAKQEGGSTEELKGEKLEKEGEAPGGDDDEKEAKQFEEGGEAEEKKKGEGKEIEISEEGEKEIESEEAKEAVAGDKPGNTEEGETPEEPPEGIPEPPEAEEPGEEKKKGRGKKKEKEPEEEVEKPETEEKEPGEEGEEEEDEPKEEEPEEEEEGQEPEVEPEDPEHKKKKHQESGDEEEEEPEEEDEGEEEKEQPEEDEEPTEDEPPKEGKGKEKEDEEPHEENPPPEEKQVDIMQEAKIYYMQINFKKIDVNMTIELKKILKELRKIDEQNIIFLPPEPVPLAEFERILKIIKDNIISYEVGAIYQDRVIPMFYSTLENQTPLDKNYAQMIFLGAMMDFTFARNLKSIIFECDLAGNEYIKNKLSNFKYGFKDQIQGQIITREVDAGVDANAILVYFVIFKKVIRQYPLKQFKLIFTHKEIDFMPLKEKSILQFIYFIGQ